MFLPRRHMIWPTGGEKMLNILIHQRMQIKSTQSYHIIPAREPYYEILKKKKKGNTLGRYKS